MSGFTCLTRTLKSSYSEGMSKEKIVIHQNIRRSDEMSKEHIVILLRHGESEWNKDNRFCGWVDVGLSDIGLKEAENAAEAIHDSGIDVTKIFTSVLKRANQTVDLILEKIDVSEDSIQRDWRLNERHYGSLTGLNKGKIVHSHLNWLHSYINF